MADDKTPDLDPAEFEPDAAKTEAVPLESLPTEIRDQLNTGPHRLTPGQFASGVDLAEREGYQRGLEHGEAKGRADAQADIVLELRRVREDAIETMHSLWVIFEVAFPDWETAEKWIRSRLTPLKVPASAVEASPPRSGS